MKILGITGGVGAGKSTILSYLERQYKARVIQADEVGKQLQQPGEGCYNQIVESFGGEILWPDGSICREKLAAEVFSNEEKLSLLNKIVHPAVKAYIVSEIEKERGRGMVPFFVIEAALLIEDRYDLVCDEIWYIHTDAKVRARRLASSRGYSNEKTKKIMGNQLDESEYRAKCNFVIDNSSDFVENTYEQIDKGLREHGFL